MNDQYVLGKLVKFKNTSKLKFSNAKDEYVATKLKNESDGSEMFLLFTERELKIAQIRAEKTKI